MSEDLRGACIYKKEKMKEIRLGTIGSGMIVRAILDNVKLTDGIRLTAVYSRSEEKGRALAQEYGADRVYTDLDAFLADEDMNFVYIASPNLLHYAQTKQALLAGKNVICEKPFCTRADQAAELVFIAKKRRLFLVDAVPTSFLPNLEIIRKELPRLGRIRLVLANYSQYSSRYDQLLAGEIPNVFNPAFGGGCLMDINFYNVYLMVLLFGRPLEAVYYPNRFGELADTSKTADTSGVVFMRYDDFVSQLAAAKDTWGVNSFQIEGEKGFLYVRDGSNGLAEVRVVTKDSDETYNDQPNPDRWFYEVQNMTKMLLAEDCDAVGKRLETMLIVMEILETVRKKAGIHFPGDR